MNFIYQDNKNNFITYHTFGLLLFLTLSIFSGCEDPFSQVIDIELPEHESRIVSYCFIDYKSNNVKIDVSKSLEALDESDANINNPTVKLYKNNSLFIDEFVEDSIISEINYNYDPILGQTMDTIFRKTLGTTSPEQWDPNAEYSLEVSSPGLETVTSSITIPELISINDIQFNKDGGVSTDGFTYDELEVSFSDMANESNYYVFTTIKETSGEYDNSVYLAVNDPRLNIGRASIPGFYDGINWASYIYFTDDEGYDGKNNTIRINLEVYSNSAGDKFLNCKLYSVSKEFYYFINNYNLYEKSQETFFSEPVSITGNMENGFGMFTIYNYDEEKVKIK